MIYIFCPSYLITPDCCYYFGFVGFFKPLKTAVYIKDTRTTSLSCFLSLFTHKTLVLKVKNEHIRKNKSELIQIWVCRRFGECLCTFCQPKLKGRGIKGALVFLSSSVPPPGWSHSVQLQVSSQ